MRKKIQSLKKKNQTTMDYIEMEMQTNMNKLLFKKKEGENIMKIRMRSLRSEAQKKLNDHLRNELGRLRSSFQMAAKYWFHNFKSEISFSICPKYLFFFFLMLMVRGYWIMDIGLSSLLLIISTFIVFSLFLSQMVLMISFLGFSTMVSFLSDWKVTMDGLFQLTMAFRFTSMVWGLILNDFFFSDRDCLILVYLLLCQGYPVHDVILSSCWCYCSMSSMRL